MVEDQAVYQQGRRNGHAEPLSMISVRFPKSWNKALKQFCLDNDTNVNVVVRELIEGFLREKQLLK